MRRFPVLPLVMLACAVSPLSSFRAVTPLAAPLAATLSALFCSSASKGDSDIFFASAQEAISALQKKRSTIDSELSRVIEEQSARYKAELVLGSLWSIPVDPNQYTVELTDYEEDATVTLELPRPKGGRGGGGREGAKAYADELFSKSKKGKRGEVTLKQLLAKIDKSIGVVEELLEMGEDDMLVMKGRVEKACQGLVKVKWGGAEGDVGDKKKGPIPAKEAVDRTQNYRTFLFPIDAASDVDVTHTVLVGRNRRHNENLSFR